MKNNKRTINAVRTASGDQGYTSLSEGDRLYKTEPIFHALGDIDEIVSVIGLINARNCSMDNFKDFHLKSIQKALMKISSILQLKKEHHKNRDITEDLRFLEEIISGSHDLTMPDGFQITGTNEIEAMFDVARAITRRAERSVLSLEINTPFYRQAIKYMNMLSDVLYIYARMSLEV